MLRGLMGFVQINFRRSLRCYLLVKNATYKLTCLCAFSHVLIDRDWSYDRPMR